MTFWETLGAIVAAQIPLFLINRYIFEKIIKKGLEKGERHAINYVKNFLKKEEVK
jgi:uncharacterized membrane protein YdjX (TVP38/TMEM64 family)